MITSRTDLPPDFVARARASDRTARREIARQASKSAAHARARAAAGRSKAVTRAMGANGPG